MVGGSGNGFRSVPSVERHFPDRMPRLLRQVKAVVLRHTLWRCHKMYSMNRQLRIPRWSLSWAATLLFQATPSAVYHEVIMQKNRVLGVALVGWQRPSLLAATGPGTNSVLNRVSPSTSNGRDVYVRSSLKSQDRVSEILSRQHTACSFSQRGLM